MFLWFSAPSIAEKIPWLPPTPTRDDQELLRLQDDAPGPPTAHLRPVGDVLMVI